MGYWFIPNASAIETRAEKAMLAKARYYGVHHSVYTVVSERILGAFTRSVTLPRKSGGAAALVPIRFEHSDAKAPHSLQQGLFPSPPALESQVRFGLW